MKFSSPYAAPYLAKKLAIKKKNCPLIKYTAYPWNYDNIHSRHYYTPLWQHFQYLVT